MSPELFFGLALKMAMTATIVVIASVAVERSGPFIGALIAALPTAAGAAYIILALEHPPAFIAGSAVGTCGQRRGRDLRARLCGVGAAPRPRAQHRRRDAHLVRRRRAVAAGGLDAGERDRAQCRWSMPSPSRPRRAIARSRPRGASSSTRPTIMSLRAAAAAVVVAAVTTASHRIGSFVSGHVRGVPDRDGDLRGDPASARRRPAAAAVFAHAQLPLVGLSLGFLGVHYLAEVIGVWWAFVAGLAITMAWSGALWLLQRRKAPA